MKQYYSDIDGLRAIAVILVVINHISTEFVSFGYLGVDVFFVISGFVIAKSLASNIQMGLGSFLLSFYSARLKRLLPVLLLVTLVSGIAISLFAPNPNSFLQTAVFAIFGLANIELYINSQDYFSRAAELNPFTHMWSLGVEEQFYFVLPILMWISVRLMSYRFFIIVLSSIVLISAFSFFYIYQHNEQFAFYMIFTRFWQLGIGIITYFALLYAKNNLNLYIGNISAQIIQLFLIIVIIFTSFLPFSPPLSYATILVCASSVGILFLTGISTQNSIVLSYKPLIHIGKLSYSIYLWHWPIIVLLRWTFGLELPFALGALLLTYALSYMSYRYIEIPLRYSDWSVKRYKEIAYALFASCILAFSIVAQVKIVQFDIYLGEPISGENFSLTQDYRTSGGAIWRGNDCVLSSNAEVGKTINLDDCIVGALPNVADTRILVMGNSFSASMVPMYDLTNFPGNNLSFFVTSSWGAAPVLGMPPHEGAWDLASVYYWNELFPVFLNRLSEGDSVMLVSKLSGFAPTPFDIRANDRLVDLRDRLTELSLYLNDRGINLLVFGPLPFVNEALCDPTAASPQWFAPDGAACNYYSKTETQQRMAPLMELLNELEFGGLIQLIDALDVFCGGDRCEYLNEQGVLLYRDESGHPSYDAAILARAALHNALH